MTKSLNKAGLFIQEYVQNAVDPNNLFRSTGHAYVKIAKEEPHLFKLYLFQKRENISSLDALYRTETNPAVAEINPGRRNFSSAGTGVCSISAQYKII